MSHIWGFNTHMTKMGYFCQNSKFLKMRPILVSLGITYPNFIILVQKMGSQPQKLFFLKKIGKSLKKIKMAISQPSFVLDQNPFVVQKWHGYLRSHIPALGHVYKRWPLDYLVRRWIHSAHNLFFGGTVSAISHSFRISTQGCFWNWSCSNMYVSEKSLKHGAQWSAGVRIPT